ncbi:hypothetical protein EMCRGX_G033846 [Ephydatia muelleri]
MVPETTGTMVLEAAGTMVPEAAGTRYRKQLVQGYQKQGLQSASSNRSSHASMGSGTSDDFDLIGLSSGEDEGACQDVLSHDEFDRRLRECAQQILSQLETGAWRQEEFSKFQLGVGEDMAHQHRSLRVEEDGGSEWPPLEDEVNCGGQESCPAGIAEERVELEGFSFLPLSSEGAVAVTTLKTGGGEDGRCGAQSVMVVPEVIGPVATTTIADIRLVPVEKLAPPSLEGLSPGQFAVSYSLQCLEVFLAHSEGRDVDPKLRNYLDESKGEVGMVYKSSMGLNNKEKHFLFSLQNPSNHIAPGHQLENITNPQGHPTTLLAAVQLPSDPSHPHLPPSPPSLGPGELMPCDPSVPLPAFLGQMMPPQLMPTYLPPPFHMWIPRPMMMHSMSQMMPMMGGAMPYLPLGPTSAATPTTAVLGDQEVLGSQLEGERVERRV